MALIEQSGGGVGFSFSNLRPEGDVVKSTGGVASGPVSFMRIFDAATEVIKAGGKRRGALMGILRVDHPDIERFITAKQKPGFLSNFNLSVAVTDEFMNAVQKNKDYDLINPRTKKSVRKLNARYIWDLIIENTWKTGDPGVIFIDEINRKNPTSNVGLIESTNPCGEQPLHPYESCNLGSINLTKFVSDGMIDWDKLARTVKLSVNFLDDVIDANKHPLPEIEKMVSANRRIGLGIMGWADTLVLLGIPYNSDKAVKLAEKLMSFINKNAHEASQQLGKERGSFPNFKGSLWQKKGHKYMRNATVTTIAPTGTLSIIAGVSSGIEPIFAVSFVRKVLEGRHLLESNRVFEQIAKEKGFFSTDLMLKIAKSGSVQNIKEVPADLRRLFVTALDISPEWHVKMQAAFQKYTDNAVSKTINFPQNAKVSDVKKAYELAYKLRCKGITIYRYGSKPEQVLYIGDSMMQVESEFSGGCPTSVCSL
jgi:ribonucleoside-diphosphate reductase alpha chain